MTDCPDTSMLVAIGEAMEWNVPGRLQHLQHCDDCRAQLELLHRTRAAFAESEAVAPSTVQHIVAAVSDASRREQSHPTRRGGWGEVLEPLAAGAAALVILTSSGIGLESASEVLLAFVLGATLLAGGKLLARGLPGLADGPTND